MQTAQPFRRAIQMMSAIQAIMGSGLMSHERGAAIARLGAYESRGKGRGTPERRYIRARSKYQPHEGKQEVARRLRQQAAIEAKHGRQVDQRMAA